uniref:Ig-like domain-containing protein n=1 Tax=Magallana gigas TaxID=29159 RepID=A0A8W8KTL9_MAGGI
MEYILFFTLCLLSAVAGDTVPSYPPGISIISSRKGYEGETVKFSCFVTSAADPPVTWTWFCGQEQIRSQITYSDTYRYTYATFRLSRKYHQKVCHCRATSPSSTLLYNMTSLSPLTLYVYHRPPTKPMIYAISSTNLRPGENMHVKCNLTSLGYPSITWRWFCDNEPPINGTSIELETYLSLNVSKSIGCRCRGTSLSSYNEYDEFSDLVQFLVFPINDPPVMISLSPMIMSEGEDVSLICSVSKLSDLDITWTWYCGKHRIPCDRTEQDGTISKITFRAEMKYHQQFCYCKVNQSLVHYVAYSNVKRMSIVSEAAVQCLSPMTYANVTRMPIVSEDATQCLSAVTFGATTGLLLASIVALSIVVVLLCVRLKKNNGAKEIKSRKKKGKGKIQRYRAKKNNNNNKKQGH